MPPLKMSEQGISHKISQGYGIGVQTAHGTKNERMKLMKFVRNCDTFQSWKIWKSSGDEENVACLHWFSH